MEGIVGWEEEEGQGGKEIKIVEKEREGRSFERVEKESERRRLRWWRKRERGGGR